MLLGMSLFRPGNPSAIGKAHRPGLRSGWLLVHECTRCLAMQAVSQVPTPPRCRGTVGACLAQLGRHAGASRNRTLAGSSARASGSRGIEAQQAKPLREPSRLPQSGL